jgi:hypothetical protein
LCLCDAQADVDLRSLVRKAMPAVVELTVFDRNGKELGSLRGRASTMAVAALDEASLRQILI